MCRHRQAPSSSQMASGMHKAGCSGKGSVCSVAAALRLSSAMLHLPIGWHSWLHVYSMRAAHREQRRRAACRGQGRHAWRSLDMQSAALTAGRWHRSWRPALQQPSRRRRRRGRWCRSCSAPCMLRRAAEGCAGRQAERGVGYANRYSWHAGSRWLCGLGAGGVRW